MAARRTPGRVLAALAVVAAAGAGGCATARSLSALREVEFALASVSQVRLAGIELTEVGSYEDLSPVEAAALMAALGAGRLPLELELGLEATNRGGAEALLARMDWTLLLAGRDTVSGTLDRAYRLPPGATAVVPVRASVNLVEFFGRNLPELVQLALAAAGETSEPVEVGLRVQPTIDTPLGPVRFPAPVTVVREVVGGPAREGGGAGRPSGRAAADTG